MKILLFGTFDHLHPGHEFVMTEALKRGDVTAVVARDSNVMRIKRHPADQSEAERIAAITAAFPAITAILGDVDDFLAPVRSIKPDLILLGYDQQLPPGVVATDLPCAVERLPAFKPDEFKSSLLKGKGQKNKE